MINIEKAIVNAYLGNSKLNEQILALEGMSSSKVRHLLNNLAAEAKGYLEVGCWKGSTLISACYGNDCPAFAIDNFSEFDKEKTTEEILRSNISKFLSGKDVFFFNNDFMEIAPENTEGSKIDLLLYDGSHSYKDQYNAIVHLTKFCEDEFVLVIDDWNHEPAKSGTIDAINDCKEYGLVVHENYILPAKFNGDLDGWWNGVWVAKIHKLSEEKRRKDTAKRFLYGAT